MKSLRTSGLIRVALVIALALIIATGGVLAAFCSTSHCTAKRGTRVAKPDCCSSSCEMMRGGDAKSNTLRATEARNWTPAAVSLQRSAVIVTALSAPADARPLFQAADSPPSSLDSSLYLRHAQFLI